MKYLFIRSQLVFVSLILLLIFGMMMAIVGRYNSRWDLTREKVFSLSEATLQLLKKMSQDPVEVLAFYPQDDPTRHNFEVFLRQCQMVHPKFRYSFYDPDRRPNLAKEWNVQELYTVVLRYQNRVERVVQPTEQNFANALFRLMNPKKIELCFVTGHGEASPARQERNGYLSFQELLKRNNYLVHEIILSRDDVPPQCQVVMVGGPHQEFAQEEFHALELAFQAGKGIFFLIDPMDSGAGVSFENFMKRFGVVLGEDVIVDKVSRMVGGDFLVPLVSQYMVRHPITRDFDQPTFFPVARSVQPSVDLPKGMEVVPLAMTGQGSWAETNLAQLEKGDAVFESGADVLGPIPIAAAVQAVSESGKEEGRSKSSDRGGRMVVVGDSDFLTNAYLDLSGNADFALNSIQWLAKDDRYISIRPRIQEFKPLLIKTAQKWMLVMFILAGIPLFILVTGLASVIWRKRTSV